MDRRKPLLVNDFELATLKILEQTAIVHGVDLYPKVRVADAIEIYRSGLSEQEYSYALKAHFDFLLTQGDQYKTPAFAVEFDGFGHNKDPQAIQNDRFKNSICEKLGLPLLRVDSSFLKPLSWYKFLNQVGFVDYTYTILSWLVEAWFEYEEFIKRKEQQYFEDFSKYIRQIHYYCHADKNRLVWYDPDNPDPSSSKLIYQLSGSLTLKQESEKTVIVRASDPFLIYKAQLWKWYGEQVCMSWEPKISTEIDSLGYATSYASIAISENRFVRGEARCKPFRFPIPIDHIYLSKELAVLNAVEKLQEIIYPDKCKKYLFYELIQTHHYNLLADSREDELIIFAKIRRLRQNLKL